MYIAKVPIMNADKKTLFDKVWDAHVVDTVPDGPQIIYIDRHPIHEVTSPQAFAELEAKGVQVFRPKQITATADHNVPTLIASTNKGRSFQNSGRTTDRELQKK